MLPLLPHTDPLNDRIVGGKLFRNGLRVPEDVRDTCRLIRSLTSENYARLRSAPVAGVRREAMMRHAPTFLWEVIRR